MNTQRIHVGVGGWTFEPWRDNFYPKGLAQAKELEYASRQLTAIEVNGTYYSTFKPETFARWAAQVPDGFVFSLKANRFATVRKVLAESAEPIARFVNSGIAELGDKLGPIVWQFMPTKQFDAADLGAFLRLLPREVGGLHLKHVLEPRHPSFDCADYFALARQHGCATVHTDSPKYPNLVDDQTPLAYLRLMRSEQGRASGYSPALLDQWAEGAKAWVGKGADREVFAFFISAAKERNPAAAMELIRRVR